VSSHISQKAFRIAKVLDEFARDDGFERIPQVRACRIRANHVKPSRPEKLHIRFQDVDAKNGRRAADDMTVEPPIAARCGGSMVHATYVEGLFAAHVLADEGQEVAA
jgi:hypothetical protein